MKVWKQAPLIRLLLPFLVGIIAAVYFSIQYNNLVYVITALALVIASITLIPKLNSSYRRSWWFGVILNLALFLSAYQLTIFKTEKFSPIHFSKYNDTAQFVYVRIKEPYLEKEKSLKVVVEVLSVKENNVWKNTCGKAMVYFKKDTHALSLKYGDEIIMKINFMDVPPPQNPGEFDYKKFLAFHNIFQQGFVKSSDWVFTGNNTGNPLVAYAINLRNKLLKVLTANHLIGDEFSVGAALLLGYVDKLDADIISAYASTGALHVLSVSGLHVAIVYLVFSWLLFFFDKIKYGNIIKAFVLILFLWFYSLLTGLSPSVLRAATMFSFIIIAKAYSRQTNIYNTLAASAFLLLVINPYLIMDVGFQLSYLAVIGIVYLQPKIYSWFEPDNWLLDQIWTITAVSIAAQIATFPLGLHYFHQFPNYFLLSNFVVIPVSTVIIYLGISVFTFAQIPLLVKYLAIAFSWSVWLLNASVKWIETWPYALLKGISITVFETWMIYGLIILFLYYFVKRKVGYLASTLGLLLVLLCFQIIEQYEQYQQKKMIVYNIPKTSAIDFINAKSNVLLTDTAFAKNESALLFHVKHNWWDLGVVDSKIVSSTIQTNSLMINFDAIQFFNKRIIILDDKNFNSKSKKNIIPLEVDYLIVSRNSWISICEIITRIHAKMIVFDSSNSIYKIKKMERGV